MSVQKRGKKWRVRWRENGDQQSRTFSRKSDADLFDNEMTRRLELGPHLTRELDRTGLTLHDFLADGFEAHAATLKPATRANYRWAITNHLADLLDEPLTALTVPRLIRYQQHLIDNGRTANTVRSAMVRLSGILQAAVEHGLLPANPVRSVRRPPAEPREEVNPLTPVQLEQLLAATDDPRGQAVILLCGHLGLRPQEARKALWSDFQGSTLTVSRVRTKSSAKRTRVLEVPAQTATGLKAWQLKSGGRGDQPIIGAWTEAGLRWWAYDHLDVIARRAIGRDDVTLYTLRHTHASTLHYCGWTVPEAARRMGHSPMVHMGVYAHPIELIGNQRWRNLEDLISEARTELAGRVMPNMRDGR